MRCIFSKFIIDVFIFSFVNIIKHLCIYFIKHFLNNVHFTGNINIVVYN